MVVTDFLPNVDGALRILDGSLRGTITYDFIAGNPGWVHENACVHLFLAKLTNYFLITELGETHTSNLGVTVLWTTWVSTHFIDFWMIPGKVSHRKALGVLFAGECDLVLVHIDDFKNGLPLDIHIRTKIRYDYSYIESAALQIGADVLEVGSYEDYAVNDVESPNMLGKAHFLAGHYQIFYDQVSKKKHVFTVVLGAQENVTISTYKHMVAVSIQAGSGSSKFFENSVGVMGSYKGLLLSRDGLEILEDMNVFGQEWQVTDEEPMLFRTSRIPQYLEKCILPSPKTAGQRRLGETIARNNAETACAHVTGSAFERCVFDVMAVGDVDIAEAGAY